MQCRADILRFACQVEYFQKSKSSMCHNNSDKRARNRFQCDVMHEVYRHHEMLRDNVGVSSAVHQTEQDIIQQLERYKS